uniref:Neur_chan_LBD domain-containing protein n=1 Tax=Syphacia muris TaxID=451379 RepID=A0A0N5AN18_9BILA
GTDHRLSGHQQRTVYVLESAPFALDQDSVLSFDVYKRTNSISLQVCLNTMTNCVYTAPKSEKKVLWRHDEQVFLPKNTTKVYLIQNCTCIRYIKMVILISQLCSTVSYSDNTRSLSFRLLILNMRYRYFLLPNKLESHGGWQLTIHY